METVCADRSAPRGLDTAQRCSSSGIRPAEPWLSGPSNRWTAKYLSPLIISVSLRDVAEWSEKSVKEEPEYENMTVKVGLRSKEINASYLVDEQTMAMKVVLPDAYPLASALVQGVNRVAVKEEKWQSWLRNCQGVITFSVSLLSYLHTNVMVTVD